MKHINLISRFFLIVALLGSFFYAPILYSSPPTPPLVVPDKPQPLVRVFNKVGHNCRILGWWNGTNFPTTPDWEVRTIYLWPDSLERK